MKIDILGEAIDQRTSTRVIYAKLPIPDYLDLVGNHFAEFEIQRRRERYKAYQRLKEDVVQGALLPSITLAVKPEQTDKVLRTLEEVGGITHDGVDQNRRVAEVLSTPDQVQILDGLQRTYILKDLLDEGHEFKEGQTLLVEFWLEAEFRNLIYRIIVLNAGQKPMSIRHQVELLFMTIREKLEKDIPGLEIFRERDDSRRNKARKYPLDRIANAYQCFVTKTPEVERDNLIAQQYVEDEAFASTEDEMGSQFELFKKHLLTYVLFDDQICRVYPTVSEGPPSGVSWFGSQNVMNSFFAAVADFGSRPERLARVNTACNVLLETLVRSSEGEDPLGLVKLIQITNALNVRKVNIGFATRKLMTSAFKEFFRSEGEDSLERCWIDATE